MTLKLDHTFQLSDFLDWHQNATPGETCRIIVKTLGNMRLDITATDNAEHLILNPDKRGPRPIKLVDAQRMLESLHRAMVAHVTQTNL